MGVSINCYIGPYIKYKPKKEIIEYFSYNCKNCNKKDYKPINFCSDCGMSIEKILISTNEKYLSLDEEVDVDECEILECVYYSEYLNNILIPNNTEYLKYCYEIDTDNSNEIEFQNISVIESIDNFKANKEYNNLVNWLIESGYEPEIKYGFVSYWNYNDY